ncbi:MAG TPA: hypothetical protein VGJ60_20570 [Chloroflexota bacterium]|jgi:hypothetical protein
MTRPYPGSNFPVGVDVLTNQPDRTLPDAIMATQSYLLGNMPVVFNGPVASSNAIKPGNGSSPGGSLWSGSGAPATGLGSIGDYYFRTDTPGTANQRIYVKTAAAVWTGIV